MIFIEDKSKRNEDWLQYITHQLNSDNNDNTKWYLFETHKTGSSQIHELNKKHKKQQSFST